MDSLKVAKTVKTKSSFGSNHQVLGKQIAFLCSFFLKQDQKRHVSRYHRRYSISVVTDRSVSEVLNILKIFLHCYRGQLLIYKPIDGSSEVLCTFKIYRFDPVMAL